MTLSYAEAKRLVARAMRGWPDPDYEAAAWAGLHRAIETHDPERGSFDAWARLCMRGCMHNAWRAKRLRSSHVLGRAEDAANVAADDAPPRDTALARVLTRAVGQLSPRQATAVELVLVQGLGNKAAGEAMGVPAWAVQNAVHAARCNLRDALARIHRETSQ